MYITRKLQTLYFFRYFKKHNFGKNLTKFFIYSITLFILLFWFIIIPILINIYVGIILYRKQVLRKIGNTIRNQFNRTFHTKYHCFLGIMIFLLYLFIFIMFILMIFTIPIILLIIIGYFIEKKNINPKKKKNQTYVYRLVDSDNLNKKESKTIVEL